jgi:hypothetical protein
MIVGEQREKGKASNNYRLKQLQQILIKSDKSARESQKDRLASEDPARFQMLAETGRKTIVEKWNLLIRGSRDSYAVSDRQKERVVEFDRDKFMPTLVSIVDPGFDTRRTKVVGIYGRHS